MSESWKLVSIRGARIHIHTQNIVVQRQKREKRPNTFHLAIVNQTSSLQKFARS